MFSFDFQTEIRLYERVLHIQTICFSPRVAAASWMDFPVPPRVQKVPHILDYA